jgi:squalene synthase HpnC
VSGCPELAAADAYCRLLADRHYENFSVASRLLPGHLRTDLARVYAYCRFTDDLGDESGERARARLDRWRTEVCDLFSGGAPVHPVLVALAETVRRRRMAAQPFVDLVSANLQDQEISAYASWEELRDYCTRSAAPVGRMVLRVFGLDGAEPERLSDDVCIGLQLANFAQDVRGDAERGRCYLIGPEVERLGVARAVQAHCERARGLLASGEALERLAPGRLRLQLALYRMGGLAILDAIERAGFRTDRVRPQVPGWTRAALVARAAVAGVDHVRSMGTV